MAMKNGTYTPVEAGPYKNINFSKKLQKNQCCQNYFRNKKCKIHIKPSGIMENIKLDFDDVPFQNLRVNNIKKSFPKVFQTDSLHYLAVYYITQRILSAAKEKMLCTVFYKDFLSRMRGDIEEPAKMFFFVEEQHLHLYEDALSKIPYVKLNRITTIEKKSFKKAICTFKMYDKISKKFNNKVKKRNKKQSELLQKYKSSINFSQKRLKIDKKNYVYVEKHNFKLARKALSCMVSVPQLKINENYIQSEEVTYREEISSTEKIFESVSDEPIVENTRNMNEISETEGNNVNNELDKLENVSKVDVKEKEVLMPNILQSSVEVIFKLTV